jgi:hypothetical protein
MKIRLIRKIGFVKELKQMAIAKFMDEQFSSGAVPVMSTGENVHNHLYRNED